MAMPQPDFNHQQTLSQPDVAVTINIQLMIAAVIFLFMVVVFIFFLYIYVKHYMGSLSRSRRRIIFTTDDQPPLVSETHGLDLQILTSLPITIYKSSDHKEVTECTVCLTELTDGEKVRILPKCNHGFHVQCIGMWFHSHSTCPVCRASITKDAVEVGSSNFPTNVLFWGNRNEGTSLSSLSMKRGNEGMLAIDIPRRGMMVEDINGSPLTVGKSPMDEVRTPSSSRLRSLRRLLSRGKMVIGSYSPRGGGDDLERGGVGEASGATPKTPLS